MVFATKSLAFLLLLAGLALLQPFTLGAANSVFTAPAEARGNTFAGVDCLAGCTGTAITIPQGRMGLVWIAFGSGEIPTVTSAHASHRTGNQWQLVTSRNFGELTAGRRGSLFSIVSNTSTASAITITGFSTAATGGTVVYAVAATGYTYIRQARIIGYTDPVAMGGNAGSPATSGQINYRIAPIGPQIVFQGITGDATGIAPEAPYTEVCFGSASGLPQGNGNPDPIGAWCMADDIGDATPSTTWNEVRHWFLCGVEVSNVATTVAQVEERGLHDFNGASTNQATQVTRSLRIPAGSAVTATITVNDGTAGDNNNVSALTVSDTSAATWTPLVVGGQASPNADTRIDGWSAYFPSDTTTTITFTRGDAVTQRWAWTVTSYLGVSSAAPISEAAGANGTATVSITLGAIAAGNLPVGNFGGEVVASIGAGTGDQELGEVSSGGANIQRAQVELGGSNVVDIAGLAGNQGSGLAWEVALGTQTIPTQLVAPPAPGGSSSSITAEQQAVFTVAVGAMAILGLIIGGIAAMAGPTAFITVMAAYFAAMLIAIFGLAAAL